MGRKQILEPATLRWLDELRRDLDYTDLSYCTCESFATSRGCTAKTIRRQLRRLNTTWAVQKSEARRRRFMREFNENPSRPGKSYAETCGFWENNSFFRVFQEWFGVTFTEFKRERSARVALWGGE